MATEFSYTETERLQMQRLRSESAELLQTFYNNFSNYASQEKSGVQTVIEQLKQIILDCDVYQKVYSLKHQQEEKTKYTVREGDTLKSLAHKFYQDHRKWVYLSYYNQLKSPILTVGTTLTIPELAEEQDN